MITSTAGRKQETVKVQEKFLTKPADDRYILFSSNICIAINQLMTGILFSTIPLFCSKVIITLSLFLVCHIIFGAMISVCCVIDNGDNSFVCHVIYGAMISVFLV